MLASRTQKKLDAVLDEYAADPFIRGIRHNIQWNRRALPCRPAFIEGIHKAGRKGFHFELCITCNQLEEVLELVRQCDDVSLMLDHLRKARHQEWLRSSRGKAKSSD